MVCARTGDLGHLGVCLVALRMGTADSSRRLCEPRSGFLGADTKDFERDTGVKVRAIYDTEETRSAGAMNRLIAEKNNPQADVYWANEPIRAEVLRQRGIAAPY